MVALVLALSAPAGAESVRVTSTSPVAAGTGSPQVRVIRIPRTGAAGASSEDQRYAMREALSRNAKNFRGGDVIVISATVAVIILLGIIIIILIV